MGIIMNKDLGKRVNTVIQYNSRIIAIKMHTKSVNIFVTYPSIMPISRYRDDKIEEMYEQIDEVIKLLKGKDNMIFVREIKEQVFQMLLSW